MVRARVATASLLAASVSISLKLKTSSNSQLVHPFFNFSLHLYPSTKQFGVHTIINLSLPIHSLLFVIWGFPTTEITSSERFKHSKVIPMSLAWKPTAGVDGLLPVFASCSGDKTVRIWEQSASSRSWNCKAVLEEMHTRTVRSCAWSPSGKLLATSSFDATTCIWEDAGGEYECVSTLEGHENEVKSVSWNASGSLLATNLFGFGK